MMPERDVGGQEGHIIGHRPATRIGWRIAVAIGETQDRLVTSNHQCQRIAIFCFDVDDVQHTLRACFL